MLRKGSKELSEKGSFGCHGRKAHDKENENKDDNKDTHATKVRCKGDVKDDARDEKGANEKLEKIYFTDDMLEMEFRSYVPGKDRYDP